jgi:hypothetical protein
VGFLVSIKLVALRDGARAFTMLIARTLTMVDGVMERGMLVYKQQAGQVWLHQALSIIHPQSQTLWYQVDVRFVELIYMTKEEGIRAIAQKRYDIRKENELPGNDKDDWRYATYVWNFFADCLAIRNAEWDMKMEEYDPYLEIYEQSLWII